jgi:hypothetical protein
MLRIVPVEGVCDDDDVETLVSTYSQGLIPYIISAVGF